MEHQTPRTHPSFWRSSGGVATAIGLGVAAVAAAVAIFEKKTPAAITPTTPTGPVATTPAVPGHWYIFSITSTTNPTVALQQTGFATVQAQPDPLTPGNWIVSAQWTGTASGVATSFTPPVGIVFGALADNGTTQPPIPTAWQADNGQGNGTMNLAVGTWYAFSVRTSFLSSANLAAAGLNSALVNSGWSGSMITAAADMSATPDTWNVYAQWQGASISTTDAPPLWILIPQTFVPSGGSAPVRALGPWSMGTTTPTGNPGTGMP